jgi:predicted DCC family thiol-disulfide oxidoreductase YuxK
LADEPKTEKLKVYYDGKCPMCTAIMDSVRNSAKSGDFDLHDMHTQRSLPFSKDAIEKEIHVTDWDGNVHRGAAAIFAIAERYPHLSVLARLGRAPLIAALAPPVYRFVAANRRFLIGPASRLFWLKTTVMVAFCIGLFLSSPLWIGPRSYPEVPISTLLPSMNGVLAYGLFGALFVLSVAIVLSSRPQKFIAVFLALMLVFCALDQTRWQPWVFQYIFILAVLALFSWDSEDIVGRQRMLNIARLIIASTYVFSGLQKLNLNFIENDFPWLVQPITQRIPFTESAFYIFGMAVPVVQVAFGVGLLTQRFRRISLIVAVSMHVFILIILGPLGYGWNDIVWPWTTAMAVFDLLLFTSSAKFTVREVLWTRGHHFHLAAFVLFAMLPILSFFNLWDSYLSSALYAGNLTEAQIYTTDAGRDALPPAISRYLVEASPDTNVLNFQRWAIEDLNVTPYPEARVFRSIGKKVCALLPDPSQFVLIVREQRMFFSRPETGYRCWQL